MRNDFDLTIGHIEGALEDGPTVKTTGLILAYAFIEANGNLKELSEFLHRVRASLLDRQQGQQICECLSGATQAIDTWIFESDI